MQGVICQPAAPVGLFTAQGFVGIVFLVMVGVVVFGALVATTARRLVRAVTGLALCYTGVAAIYYFLLSPFVAMMQMLIYVGAVSVLIAFAIMMADPEDHTGDAHPGRLAGPFGAGVAGMVFAALSILGAKTQWQPKPKTHAGNIQDMGVGLLTTHSLVFEVVSIVLLIAILGALVLARKGRD